MNERSKIAVIILNWNGSALLRQFLPTLIAYTDTQVASIYVADNGSSDDSLDMLSLNFPSVSILVLEKNFGFAEGYNRAINMVSEEYVVLLNSDVEVTPNWLTVLSDYVEHNPNVAAVQPKILAYNEKKKFEYAGANGGYIDKYGYPFCRGRILSETETDSSQYDSCEHVFWCSGAAFLVKRSAYIEAGGLDVNFFAHMEEIDLCWRMHRLGFELAVCPDSFVYHVGGATLPMNHPKKLYLNYRNNLLMLYKNLSMSDFYKLMSIRIVMDFASILVFLMHIEFKNVKSVISAYSDFFKMKSRYSHANQKFQRECVYPGSVVFEFYFRGVKRFSDLRYKLLNGYFVK